MLMDAHNPLPEPGIPHRTPGETDNFALEARRLGWTSPILGQYTNWGRIGYAPVGCHTQQNANTRILEREKKNTL